MASTTFSGPVTSTNGFVGAVTGDVTGDVTATSVSATTVTATGAVTATSDDNVIVIPTSDPGVAGAIWYNVDTLAISTGE